MKLTVLCVLFLLAALHTANARLAMLINGGGGTQSYIPGQNQSNYVQFGLPQNRGAVVVFNRLAYFIGGLEGSETANVTVFDPATNTSSTGPSMISARGDNSATVVGDKIITCGGMLMNSKLASCEQYSLDAPVWTAITPLPQAMLRSCMVTLNSKAYIFGGWGADKKISTCHTYSTVFMLKGSEWVARTPMPYSRNAHSCLALDDNRALICGGWGSSSTSDVEPKWSSGCKTSDFCSIYNAALDAWEVAPAMLRAKQLHKMMQFNGRAYVVGGSPGGSGSVDEYPLRLDEVPQTLAYTIDKPAGSVAEIDLANSTPSWLALQQVSTLSKCTIVQHNSTIVMIACAVVMTLMSVINLLICCCRRNSNTKQSSQDGLLNKLVNLPLGKYMRLEHENFANSNMAENGKNEAKVQEMTKMPYTNQWKYVVTEQ